MGSHSEYHETCYECDRTFSRALEQREVHMDKPGGGYDVVPVPMCPECIGQTFGWDCPNCGLHHDSREDAEYCCKRRPGEAPDCPECGRRMERGAWGYSPGEGQTVDWAECEACEIGWGRFTGWHDLNEAETA